MKRTSSAYRRSTFALRTAAAAALGLLAVSPAARADGVDVSPLVNENTFAVARVDVSKLKLRAVADWLQQTLHDAKVPDALTQDVIRGMKMGTQGAQPMVDALARAGVTQVAFVVNLDEKGFREQPHVMMAIATADPDAITAAIRPIKSTTTDLDGVTVWSDPATPDYVRQITPSPRADLIAAIAEPATNTVIGAVGVAEARRAALLKGLPNGRDPFNMPPALSLFDNVNIARVQIDTSAGPRVAIAADTKDPAAASKFIDGLRTNPAAKDLLNTVPIITTGQTLSAEVKQHEFEQIAAGMTPLFQSGKKQAERVKSMSNMRSLMQACFLYSNDNKGNAPSSLDILGKYAGTRDGKTNSALLTNPQRPELGAAGYAFIPPSEGRLSRVKKVQERLAIYEAGDFGEGLNVAFWDGHVEFIADRARFDALLAAAKTPPAATPPAPAP